MYETDIEMSFMYPNCLRLLLINSTVKLKVNWNFTVTMNYTSIVLLSWRLRRFTFKTTLLEKYFIAPIRLLVKETDFIRVSEGRDLVSHLRRP